jgi:hypothetical protein
MVRLNKPRVVTAAVLALGVGASLCMAAMPASATARPALIPGDLLVSRLHYTGTASLISPGTTVLPTGATAIADGSFAHVWDNVTVDGNFGVTAPISLDQLTTSGAAVNTTAVPDGTPGSSSTGHDLLTGSFSSKSEGALNLSTDGSSVSFMGYVAPQSTLDASNGNTPGVIDPTNPDAQAVYRGVAQLDASGRFSFTETNAYSGDNGRAAILDSSTGSYFTAGNSNNGAGTSVPGVIYGTGAQLIAPANTPEQAQKPTGWSTTPRAAGRTVWTPSTSSTRRAALGPAESAHLCRVRPRRRLPTRMTRPRASRATTCAS